MSSSKKKVIDLNTLTDEQVIEVLFTDFYAAMTSNGDKAKPVASFKAQAATRPELTGKADTILNSLNGIDEQRCYISKLKKQFLTEATKGA